MLNHVESVRAAQELEISIREIRTQFDRYLITQDKNHLEPVPRMRDRTSSALADCEKSSSTPQEFALMKRIRSGYDHFFAEYASILQKPNFALYPKIIALIDNVLTMEILGPAHEYARLNEGMLAQTTQSNRDLSDRLTTGMVALGLCGAFGGMLAGTVFTVALRRSLLLTEKRLKTTAEQLDLAAYPGHPNRSDGVPVDAVERMTASVSAILKRLRHSENDALRAEQLAWVGQMAAGIAHEIRNPLMSIKVLVQATAERSHSPGFRPRDLQVLEEEIIRLEQIVSGFLDFARPPRPESRPIDVKALVERVIDGVKARAQLQGVEMYVQPTSGPTVVSADPNQIRQIVFNLLFNALDAQPQGGKIHVRIGIENTVGGFPQLELQVEDTGPGLPNELGDQIFEPFVSTKETGLGLGLSICRRIAEAHSGSLSAKSAPTGGAVFILRIPMLDPNPQFGTNDIVTPRGSLA
jgi:signal transduction histidine kinase